MQGQQAPVSHSPKAPGLLPNPAATATEAANLPHHGVDGQVGIIQRVVKPATPVYPAFASSLHISLV